MITLISLATMQVPGYDKISFKQSEPVQQTAVYSALPPSNLLKTYFAVHSVNTSSFTQEFRLPQNAQNKSFQTEVMDKYSPAMKTVIADFTQRANQKGQFLHWVDLPKNQLEKNASGKSHVDEIYAQSAELKNRTTDNKTRPLVVLGIGGSRNPVEFLLDMNGLGNKGKVFFYSDIEPVSYANFLQEVGGDVRNLNFLVVSKSGTTFETSDGFKRFENGLIEAYKKQGMNEQQAKEEAQKHFAIATDKTATDKNFRGKIGDKNGAANNYIKELYIHDDVGGRFSMFDDPGIFVLAYAGIDKPITERILKSADNANKQLMDTKNLNSNSAAKSAMFNVYSREHGFKIIEQQLFGKLFEMGGENWCKQLYSESLKDFDFMVGRAPDSMHYATEAQFDNANRSSYNTIMTVMNPKISENYNRYIKAIAETYNEKTPLTNETLEVEGDRIKPEAIGSYIQSKHFETIYAGMLRREAAGKKLPSEQALPEVLQPSVETYKNKFKPGSPYELIPGGN